MKTKILAAIIITTIFMGCTSGKRYHQVLNLAENELKSNPQKALTLLDSLQEQYKDFPTWQKMKYELLRQDALNRTDYVFKSDSTAKVLADYYDQKGTPNEKMKAYYLLGRAYMDMKEWPAALQSMLDAASKADTTARDCDYYTLCRAHGQASEIYRFQMMPNNELQESILSEKYARKANDTLAMINEYATQAFAYQSMGGYYSVIDISERAAKLYLKYGYKHKAAIAIGYTVHDLVLLGQYKKAARYINYYKAYSGLFDAKGNIARGFESFYYVLGLYYMGINRPGTAEYFLRKELRDGKNYYNQRLAHYGLAKLYTKTGKPALAARHALLTMELENVFSDVCNTVDHLQHIQSLYDYSRNQNIAKQKTTESEYFRIIIFLLGAVIVLLIVSFYLFFKKRAEKVRRAREDDQRMINELASNYQDLQRIRNTEKEQYDLVIKEKEEGMKLQSAEIFDAKNYGQEATEETTLIKTSEIYQRFLTHLSTNVRERLTDEDWADLKEWIKTNFQTLYDDLFIKNALSDKDYKICMLAIIRFSPSDIAALLDCSMTNISAARRRIVEKLTGRHGRAQELDKILKASPQPQ
jgi:hypothetical protein